MERYNQMKEQMETLLADMEKFYTNGNKSAAVRAREACQEIKRLAQEIRVDIAEKRKA